MVKKVLKLWSNPWTLLRRILAMDDSPHAIAMGVAVGVFIGLTPTVGFQTILIVALVFLSRRFWYFNTTAAIISTYVSNPVTMLPMYYFWYQLGAWVLPGAAEAVNLEVLTNFDGIAGWWTSICDLGLKVAGPMFLGALFTAPIGAIPAYLGTYYALNRKLRRMTENADVASENGTSAAASEAGDAGVSETTREAAESPDSDSVMTPV